MVNISIPQISNHISNTLLFTVVIFILGLYFAMNYSSSEEGFVSSSQPQRCPNILIQNGTEIFLYNSQVAKVPGVNPIKFNNLEDYVEFMKWQRSQGIVCPVLYLQQTNDAQGKNIYKIRPLIYRAVFRPWLTQRPVPAPVQIVCLPLPSSWIRIGTIRHIIQTRIPELTRPVSIWAT